MAEEVTPRASDTELLELVGTDVRYVAIIWHNDDGDETAGRPRLVMGGISEFEAAALLRSATMRLEDRNFDLIDLDDEVDEEDMEDEA